MEIKTVYIVCVDNEWHETRIVKVFDDKQKAETFVELCNQTGLINLIYYIEEWNVE